MFHFGVSPAHHAMLKYAGQGFWLIGRFWEFGRLMEKKSINQKTNHFSVIRYISNLILGRISVHPRIDSEKARRRFIELNSINTVTGPTTVKIQPAIFKKYKPLVFHCLRNQAGPNSIGL